MIGPRCLGPGGSAVRSSAARIRSTSGAAQLTAPLAECSYRLWRPPQPLPAAPQNKASPSASRCVRCLSSAASTSRTHTSSPHVSVSVDQHGIESILHDPPFTHAKVKRLRPVSVAASNTEFSDVSAQPQHADRTGSETTSFPHNHPGNATTESYSLSLPTHPPDCLLQLPPKLLPSRFHSDIPSDLLLGYLTASDESAYKDIQAQLPSGFRRIDAYLLLREHNPQCLSALSLRDIWYLVKKAGKDNLGGVLALLLEDVTGSGMTSAKAKPGNFQISSGTDERYKLLREILVQCNRNDLLHHDGTALNVFMLMLDDLIQLRQSTNDTSSGTDHQCSPSTSAAPSTVEGAIVSLPANFPVGETRRLVKLAMHLHSPELAPVVNALRAHLEAQTPDFPTAREGSQLIAYYLQPNVRDFAAALDVVRALRDTNALPQELVDDAVRDGKAYLASLEAFFANPSDEAQTKPSDAELQQICMDVSLRLIAMKSLMAQRPKGGVQYRKAFESLVASFRLDLVDAHQSYERRDMRSLLNVPMRSTRSVFLHLIGQDDASCLTEALFALQRSDQRIVAMLPNNDLQEFCNAAQSNNCRNLAAETYSLFVKAKTSTASTLHLPFESKHILARDGVMIDTESFLVVMRELVSSGQKITMAALLRVLRLLPLSDNSVGQLNLRFSSGQRSRLIALLAEAGLTEDAFALFQYWSHWRYQAGSDSPQSSFGAASLRTASIQVADPLIERQIRLMHGTDRQVATSAECLVGLVRSICRPPSLPHAKSVPPASTEGRSNEALHVSWTLPSQLDKARFVIDVFRHACTPTDWTHYRLSALAQACFMAKDVAGAFDALAKISFLREIPDKVDIAVLMGGLVELDADKAVDLYIRHCTVRDEVGAEKKTQSPFKAHQGNNKLEIPPTLAPMQPTPALTSMLMSRALAQNRMDLVDRLHGFSEAVGIASLLGHEASMRALFSGRVTPSKVKQTVKRLVEDGRTIDVVLLENLARRLLWRSMQGTAKAANDLTTKSDKQGTMNRTKAPSAKDRLLFFQAACYLVRVSAGKQDVINLLTVSRALDAVVCEGNRLRPQTSGLKSGSEGATVERAATRSGRFARKQGQDERRSQWIAGLDSIVYLLRWSRLFDRGDDLRQNLPLWKSGNAGNNGQLVSAELEEMVDYGFVGSGRRRSMIRTNAATAATMPTFSEAEGAAASYSTDGLADDGDSFQVAPSNGVTQRSVHRSPNVLPPDLFCRLVEAYMALGDVSGAAEVASWMRDEARIDLGDTAEQAADFVNRIKAAVLVRESKQTPGASDSHILRMLAGQQSTARTKRWWSP